MIDSVIRGFWKFVAFVLVVVLVAFVVIVYRYRADFELGSISAVGLVLVLVVTRVVLAVTRFAVAPWQAKRNYPRMLWSAFRWHWLTRNLALAAPDPHNHKTIHRGALGPALGAHTRVEHPKGKVRYPRARWRADEYGILAAVKIEPKAGRLDFEKNAQRIADSWRCWRVQVTQPKPGRVVLRGILRDPLSEVFGPELAPAGTYQRSGYSPVYYLGRDEWATHRTLNLRGVTGIAIGGLPDYGKTSLIRSLMCQDYTTAATQYVVIDGKGGGDYQSQQERIWLPIVGNDLEAAAETLTRCEQLMNKRLAAAGHIPGPVNRWEVGPTGDYPRIGVIIDECHSFFDLEAVRGDKHAEQLVRRCRTAAGNMIRMGRSVLFFVVVITQKQTGDAVPTAIRDICQIRIGFASGTESAAEAILGERIKDYPSYSPTGLQEKPTYVGVCTANLRTGSDPFVRLRVPNVTDAEASAQALETAYLKSDPEQLLALVLAPADTIPVQRSPLEPADI